MRLTSSQLNRALKEQIKDVEERRTEALLTAITIGIGQYAALKTPIMTSNLINSQYRNVQRKTRGWQASIGYGAKYAFYVHEAPGTYLGTATLRRPGQPRFGNFWDKTGEPKFLEKGVKEFVQNDLSATIKRIMTL